MAPLRAVAAEDTRATRPRGERHCDGACAAFSADERAAGAGRRRQSGLSIGGKAAAAAEGIAAITAESAATARTVDGDRIATEGGVQRCGDPFQYQGSLVEDRTAQAGAAAAVGSAVAAACQTVLQLEIA